MEKEKRPSGLPIIIVTGASGFIGHYFLEAFKYDFYIYALARRSQKEAGITMHKNINWIRVDIGEKEMVEAVIDKIALQGGADYLLHLAAYYDFGNGDNIEYKRTNVLGTKYILENATKLNLKRLIFASSVIVTEYFEPDLIVDESSPANANFPYAKSKYECEEMIKKYASVFPCAIVRLAAIFSDWCEYGPLYVFLSNWLSNSWKSRMIAGKGTSAVPYFHVKNLNGFIAEIIKKSDHLPQLLTLVAANDGCCMHKQLFEIAVRYNYSYDISPRFMPKWFVSCGIILMDIWGRIRGMRPFERPWMIKYIDHQLNVDASKSREILSWKPIARYEILRRILFLIENMKSDPVEWDRKNEEVIYKQAPVLPNLKIYEIMLLLEDEIKNSFVEKITGVEYQQKFKTYQSLGINTLKERIEYIYRMLKIAVRTGDRLHVLAYARNLALERFKENFEAQEVINAIRFFADFIVEKLNAHPQLKNMEQRIHDQIMMTIQLIADEIEDSFDRLMGLD